MHIGPCSPTLEGPSEVVRAQIKEGNAILLVSPIHAPPSLLLPAGGRLTNFSLMWSLITSDAWILQSVPGFRLEFTHPPHHQTSRLNPFHLSQSPTSLLFRELRALLDKGAIKPAPDSFAPLFGAQEFQGFPTSHKSAVPQPLGGLSPLQNGGHTLTRDLLQDGDWFPRLDLKDVYLTVPVHPDSRCFLSFTWRAGT